ncbi:hypothetical protein K0M31_014411 [Melipona bicolor]|uniref:Uncharacterized protein n=1 Tax=Melipona bicolor TaxID=60889 RepID=A0AA40KUG9_9HYME|nr:hypothetical protein K0M31_014411 [Melipona bicolor]
MEATPGHLVSVNRQRVRRSCEEGREFYGVNTGRAIFLAKCHVWQAASLTDGIIV